MAAAQGIDVLNLVKTKEQQQQDLQQRQQQAQQQSLVDQAGQLAGAPMMDPQKNPDAMDMAGQFLSPQQQQEQKPPEE